MSKLLYLDVFRMTSPGETLKRKLFDFYVFGSFDAIKVETTPGEGSISISTFQELHNFWRMDTRDFSHERKCAITPFPSNIHSHFCLFCVIIILRRQRTDAAGTDH